MKLMREQVEQLNFLILKSLRQLDLVTLKASEEVVLKKMNEVFTADLSAEDTLDREVEKILSAHSQDLDTGRVDYRRMFNMVKHKLARERGIIL